MVSAVTQAPLDLQSVRARLGMSDALCLLHKLDVKNVTEAKGVEADAGGKALRKSARGVGKGHGLGLAHGDSADGASSGDAR
jgi:hypothetical protein